MRIKLIVATLLLSLVSVGFSQEAPKTPAQVTAQQHVESLASLQKDLLKDEALLQAERELYYNKLRDIAEFQKYEETLNQLQDFQRRAKEFQTTQQAAIKALDDANQAAANAQANATKSKTK